jgi:hypothetical protein
MTLEPIAGSFGPAVIQADPAKAGAQLASVVARTLGPPELFTVPVELPKETDVALAVDAIATNAALASRSFEIRMKFPSVKSVP